MLIAIRDFTNVDTDVLAYKKMKAITSGFASVVTVGLVSAITAAKTLKRIDNPNLYDLLHQKKNIPARANSDKSMKWLFDCIASFIKSNKDVLVVVDIPSVNDAVDAYKYIENKPTVYISGSFTERYPILKAIVAEEIDKSKIHRVTLFDTWKAFQEFQKEQELYRNVFRGDLKYAKRVPYDKTQQFYHISTIPNVKTLYPQSPSVPLEWENIKIKRISVCTNIRGCFNAVAKTNGIFKYFIYRALVIEDTPVYQPDPKYVPDVERTRELWITEPVNVELVDTKYVKLNHGKFEFLTEDEVKQHETEASKATEAAVTGTTAERVDIEILNELKKIMIPLDDYKYGFMNKDGKLSEDFEIDFKDYRTLSVKQFEKIKAGICWDYAMYQFYLINKKFGCFNFFIQLQNSPKKSTHTFTLIPYMDKVIYVESSFERIAGIYYAENSSDTFSFIIRTMMDHEQLKNKVNATIIQINGPLEYVNKSPDEYLNEISKHGTRIRDFQYNPNAELICLHKSKKQVTGII